MLNIYILFNGAFSNDAFVMALIGIISIGASIFTARIVTIRGIDKAINQKIDRTEAKKMIEESEEKTDLKIATVGQRIDSTQEFYTQLKADNTNGHNEIKGLLKEIRKKL